MANIEKPETGQRATGVVSLECVARLDDDAPFEVGRPFFDMHSMEYLVPVDRFVARPINDAELRELARTTPSEGVGWCLNMMQPWFPGISCCSCGRFVGRDGSIEVEHFEMSFTIASVDGECRRCIDTRTDRVSDPMTHGRREDVDA